MVSSSKVVNKDDCFVNFDNFTVLCVMHYLTGESYFAFTKCDRRLHSLRTDKCSHENRVLCRRPYQGLKRNTVVTGFVLPNNMFDGPLTHKKGPHTVKKCNYNNGKLEGSYTTYRLINIIHKENVYLEGRRHGICKDYNSFGTLIREITYKRGLKHGIHIVYYYDFADENGVEYVYKIFSNYVNGRPYGLSYCTRETINNNINNTAQTITLMVRTYNKHWLLHGFVDRFYDNGALAVRTLFHMGDAVSVECFPKTGSFVADYTPASHTVNDRVYNDSTETDYMRVVTSQTIVTETPSEKLQRWWTFWRMKKAEKFIQSREQRYMDVGGSDIDKFQTVYYPALLVKHAANPRYGFSIIANDEYDFVEDD